MDGQKKFVAIEKEPGLYNLIPAEDLQVVRMTEPESKSA